MSISANRKAIKKMLANPPSSWQKMFLSKGLPAKPKSVDKVIEKILSLTPTERSSGPSGDKAHTPPAKTRQEAMKGLKLSFRENYTSASGIGLARAMQLAIWPKIWDRSVRRMDAYFDRHDKDQNARNFGNDKNPSRGYMAWLNWGGDSGEVWAEKTKAKMRGNPMYRKNFFGLFSSKPQYYVYEAIVTAHDPTSYSEDQVYDYLRNINRLKYTALNDALRSAQRLINERKRTKRGGNMIFVVEENNDEISFVDFDTATKTVNLRSFAEFKNEWKTDYDSNRRLNPQGGYPQFNLHSSDWTAYKDEGCYTTFKDFLRLARKASTSRVPKPITIVDKVFNRKHTVPFLTEAQVLDRMVDLSGSPLITEKDIRKQFRGRSSRSLKKVFNFSPHPVGFNVWPDDRLPKTVVIGLSGATIRFSSNPRGDLLIIFYDTNPPIDRQKLKTARGTMNSLCFITGYGFMPNLSTVVNYSYMDAGYLEQPFKNALFFMADDTRNHFLNYANRASTIQKKREERALVDRIYTGKTIMDLAERCYYEYDICKK